MQQNNTRVVARTLGTHALLIILTALNACATDRGTAAQSVADQPTPTPMVQAAPPRTSTAERFIGVGELNALALSFPRPPAEVAEFDLAVTLLLKKHAADWPRAAQRGKETAPKDVYSSNGYDYLVLVDDKLATDVKNAATPEAKAAACRARCPATCALLDRATRDLVTSKYKPFERPRPTGDRKDSYPSGHAAQAVLQCRLIWEVLRTSSHAEAEETLLCEAYARAFDRVVIAVHHPTDIAAGVAFGLAAARMMIDADTPAFHEALAAAREEW